MTCSLISGSKLPVGSSAKIIEESLASILANATRDMRKFAGPLMEKFFDYYTSVTAHEGALTKREKSLIALAVAHSKQCPYCIEAYTSQCLETGSTPEQMHEAVHVAAALAAGIDLVHGVQMQNALRAKQVIN